MKAVLFVGAVGLVVALQFSGTSDAVEPPKVSKGPGGSKFVTLSQPKAQPESETRFQRYKTYIADAVGWNDPTPEERAAAAMAMTEAKPDDIRRALELARKYGSEEASRLLGPEIEIGEKPRSDLPQTYVFPWSD